ncbi:MAG: thioredoxin [Chloroflexi bacterium]|nr:thioredoxin [Chloroflexota bacterium]
MSHDAAYVINVNDAEFEHQVIENSKSQPVIVDFWAPWCGPCRTLGPTLERLAQEGEGSWLLVKVNVDNNQHLARMYGVQGIPAVKAFKDGKIVDQFTGAIPESQIKSWLKKFVSDRPDTRLQQIQEVSDTNTHAARQAYAALLSEQPTNHAARIAYAQLLMRLHDSESVNEFAKIPLGSEQYDAAQAWLIIAKAMQEAVISSSGVEEQYYVAVRAISRGEYAVAIEGLLVIVRTARQWRDDAARKTIIALLNALGNSHPLVSQARKDLAAALF